jgi:hypothetical protein
MCIICSLDLASFDWGDELATNEQACVDSSRTLIRGRIEFLFKDVGHIGGRGTGGWMVIQRYPKWVHLQLEAYVLGLLRIMLS